MSVAVMSVNAAFGYRDCGLGNLEIS